MSIENKQVICIIGNPPYNIASTNNGDWIMKLLDDYKKEPGGKEKLKERNPKSLNDDYVKFLRYGQHYIEKNGIGILAFITPHGFLDILTSRGVRWNLLNAYDKIYVIDMHGNTRKREVCPDGSIDQNVFDIMQGVAINIFIKTGKKKPKELGKVFHYDLYGKRDFKYDFLTNNSIETINFRELNPNDPNFFFVSRNEKGRKKYESGFKLNELMPNNKTGIVSMGDKFIIDKNPNTLLERIKDFLDNEYSEEKLRNKYKLGDNYAKWIIGNKNEIRKFNLQPTKISYRPFDNRYTIFSDKFLSRCRHETMQHFILGTNLGIVFCRQQHDLLDSYIFCSKNIVCNGYIWSERIAPTLSIYRTDYMSIENKQVMCVIGNPPYVVKSTNNGDWIMKLLDDYKKEPGGKEKLKERNPKSINDDYVKFLRYGQHCIEENGIGILAFITPHGFLDNITFRGMRWNLLKTYDKIYIIDLHGNSRKREVCPDGSKDVNVFDVMQGVSINIFIRTGNKSKEELAKVFHHEIYGERDFKYNFLNNSSLKTIDFKEVKNIPNNYFFIPKDFKYKDQYDKGFKLNELFTISSTGILTDKILVNNEKEKLQSNVENHFNIKSNSDFIKIVSYRIFDKIFIYLDSHLVYGNRIKTTYHFLKGDNIGLITVRMTRNKSEWRNVFISNKLILSDLSISPFNNCYVFPLYLMC